MRKLFTVRSLFAILLVCASTSVFAQWPFAGFWNDGELSGETGAFATFGKKTDFSFLCAGENLTADVEFTITSSSPRDGISPQTIVLKRDDLLNKTARLNFAYTYYKDGNAFHTLSIALRSLGSDDFEGISISITVTGETAPYAGLGELIEAINAVKDKSLPDIATVTGDFVVTHVYNGPHNTPLCYMQDEAYGVVYDNSDKTYQVGEHYNQLSGWAQLKGTEYEITYETYLAEQLGTPTRTEAATPAIITVDEVAAHHGRLVQLKNIQLGETGSFTECDTVAVTIGDQSAHICLFPGSDLVGESIPSRADITGILRSVADGKIMLSPRSKADIIAIEEDVTGLTHTELTTPARKVIENGRIYIIKNGVRYNILGAKE